jgi:hypothetical protein
MTSRCDRDLKEKVTYRRVLFLGGCPALHNMLFVQGYWIKNRLNKKKENTHECMDANNKVLSTFENSFRHGMCVLCTISTSHIYVLLAGCCALFSIHLYAFDLCARCQRTPVQQQRVHDQLSDSNFYA